MSLRDYWTDLSKRVVTQAADGMGGFTESTADTAFRGRVCELSATEVLRNKQLGNDATATLFTETDLVMVDRVVDGTREYEVVGVYTDFHKHYDLRRVK